MRKPSKSHNPVRRRVSSEKSQAIAVSDDDFVDDIVVHAKKGNPISSVRDESGEDDEDEMDEGMEEGEDSEGSNKQEESDSSPMSTSIEVGIPVKYTSCYSICKLPDRPNSSRRIY